MRTAGGINWYHNIYRPFYHNIQCEKLWLVYHLGEIHFLFICPFYHNIQCEILWLVYVYCFPIIQSERNKKWILFGGKFETPLELTGLFILSLLIPLHPELTTSSQQQTTLHPTAGWLLMLSSVGPGQSLDGRLAPAGSGVGGPVGGSLSSGPQGSDWGHCCLLDGMLNSVLTLCVH
jgi:hypothetical protein